MGILDTRFLRDFDWLLFLLPIGLVGFGTIFIYSAQPTQSYWVKQLIFLGIGVVLCLVSAFVDYRKWLQFAPVFYVGMLFALVLVLLIGEKINGQRAWINLGVTNFQPSEFAKLATMLMVARALTSDKGRRGPLSLKEMAIAGGIVAVPVGLILLQPDTGTVLTYFPVLLTMLFLSGLKVRWLLTAVVAGALAVTLAWGFVLKDYQKQRIEMALMLAQGQTSQLTLDQRRGNGYQSLQSIIAVGSGGLTGKGIGQGTQGRLGFLPERHTDFIASILSEETGFLGAVTMLGLYSLLIWRLVSVARLARERFGALVVMGLATLFIFHIFVNLGMVVGLMPIMGIPLPFLSYGGSSLLMVFAGIGFALSLRLRRFVN